MFDGVAYGNKYPVNKISGDKLLLGDSGGVKQLTKVEYNWK